jgi:CRISPR-associated endoribonuclease Cas6
LRVCFEFRTENELRVPVSYNYGVQSLIYKHIDEKLAAFLHDKGYVLGKRRFKLFTFSRIQGKARFLKSEESFAFKPPFRIVVSSPVGTFIESLAENFVRSAEVQLFGQLAYLESINVYCEPHFDSETVVVMLSAVTMYSTLPTPDGRKKTYYYTPFEKEFSWLLEENLKKKYEALYKEEPNGLTFSIQPLGVNKNHEKIIDYKGTVIKGWMGQYRLKGSPELLSLGYDTGLGSKNSQGFGCFEIIAGSGK